MNLEELCRRVADRAGLAGPAEARPVVRAVLETVGEALGPREAEALAAELPPEARGWLGGGGGVGDLAELHRRVARREGTRPGFAAEHAGVVCQAVGEALPPGARYQLQQALPAALGALFEPGEPPPAAPPPHLDPRRRTLAEGRPGGGRPLYAARAGGPQGDSVAEANPHGETKLSSARGLTQEREGETLAEGRPGAERPLGG